MKRSASVFFRIADELRIGDAAALAGAVPITDPFDQRVLDRAESLIFEVAERRVADTLVALHPALEQTLVQLEHLYDRDTSIVGVPTGYHDLDELLKLLAEP